MLDALNASPLDAEAHAYQSAIVHVGLGEKDRALDRLWGAYRNRTWTVRLLKVDPLVDPLRSEARFQALLGEMGLKEDPTGSPRMPGG